MPSLGWGDSQLLGGRIAQERCPVAARCSARRALQSSSPIIQPNKHRSRSSSSLSNGGSLAAPCRTNGVAKETDMGASQKELSACKADLVVVRTDGISCSRETVNGSGTLMFESTSTHQHLLVWRTRPKCVMVIKRWGEELYDECLAVVKCLGDHEMQVVLEPKTYDYISTHHPELDFVHTFAEEDRFRLGQFVDFIICLGGDGVILHAANLFMKCVPPVISFNMGSLGFLTNHKFEDFEADIHNVIYGSEDTSPCALPGMFSAGVLITLRMRLTCTIHRRGDDDHEKTYECLNEIVVDRGSSPYLTNIECYERGRLITRVQADGVIIATPTGSTAYSVGAGGSMVHPNVPAILMTPICPHSLTFRPVVFPDYAEIELKIPDESRSQGWVSFDGRSRQELHRGDGVKVCMSRYPVPTISRADQTQDWFSSLERCFGWNERLQQKPLG